MPSMLYRRTIVSGSAAAASLAVFRPRPMRAAAGRTIRIGYQRYGTLILLKHLGLLETALAKTGDAVSWSEHPAGPQLLQAMGAGAVDFGITGDTPPIFAQGARNGIVYVAHEPKAPFGEAIIVPAHSPLRSVADLRSKTVALNKGSNVHWLLLAALRKAGLTSADIVPAYLPPAAGRAAFDSGRIDAWAIWDPYLSSVETASAPKVLTTADGLVGNRQFFLADRGFAAAHPDLISTVLAQIKLSDAWSQAHPAEVSRTLADDTGLPLPVVRRAVDRLSYGASAMTPDIVAEQQQIADAFLAQRLLPAPVDVSAAIWHPS